MKGRKMTAIYEEFAAAVLNTKVSDIVRINDEDILRIERVLFALKKKNARQEIILRLRFGLFDGQKRTFEEVAQILDMSPDTVKAYQKIGLAFLRKTGVFQYFSREWLTSMVEALIEEVRDLSRRFVEHMNVCPMEREDMPVEKIGFSRNLLGLLKKAGIKRIEDFKTERGRSFLAELRENEGAELEKELADKLNEAGFWYIYEDLKRKI